MQNELSQTLAEQIRQAYQEAITEVENTKALATEAVKKAAYCGEMLTEARQETKAHFREWLSQHCPEVDFETAQKWINGAKKIKELGGIETFGGKQLLLFFAQGDEKPEREQQNRDPENKNWFAELGKFTERFNKAIEHRKPEQWTEEEKLSFRHRVKPIVELYNSL